MGGVSPPCSVPSGPLSRGWPQIPAAHPLSGHNRHSCFQCGLTKRVKETSRRGQVSHDKEEEGVW